MSSYEHQLDLLADIVKRLNINVEVIAEAGARDCLESVAFTKIFPEAKVFAFECNPENISICRQNILGTSVTLIEEGISDKQGTMDFHILDTPDRGSSSVLQHKTMPSRTVTVPVTRLDKVLKDFPTILWLDTQGSELAALKGCGDRIVEIKVIHTEVYFNAAYENQPLYWDIKSYLYSKGFKLYGFTAVTGGFRDRGFGDALFINKSISIKTKPAWLIEIKAFYIDRIIRKIKKLFFWF